MNRILIGILFIGSIVLAYLAGIFYPKISIPEIEPGKISQVDFNTMVLRFCAAIATFLAAFVALFKEDIRSLYRKVDFIIEVPEKSIQESTSPANVSTGDGQKEFLSANYYTGNVLISNRGTIPALNSELYLEKLLFIKGTTQSKNIEVSGRALKWDKEEETKSLIPSKGQRICQLVFIDAPQNESLPDGSGTKGINSRLYIGDTEVSKEYHKGKLEAHFAIHSISCKCKNFILYIEWDGKWHERITEMADSLTLNLSE